MKRHGFFGVILYFIILKEGRSSDCDECSDYLISGPRGISDEKLTASSVYTYTVSPKYGRLHSSKKGGGWAAKTANDQQYIQAEFSKPKLVRAILTQGRIHSQWVKSYSVSYSVDGITWLMAKDIYKNTIIYSANNDTSTVVRNNLPQCLEAKYIRLHPKTWHEHVSLRFDVIGCSKLEPKNSRRKMNWKRHPIILHPHFKQNQVFKTSSQEINICAMKCQQNSLCQSFSLNQMSSVCTGYEKPIYNGDKESFSALGEEAYFISVSQLEAYEYEILENPHLCYKIFTSKKTAGSASTVCKGEKSRLLTIHNFDEMNVIMNSIKTNLILSQETHFYVDGSSRNGLWKYATDQNIPASLWSPSHPLLGQGGCVTLTLNGLETHDCMDNLYFICGV